MIVFHKKMSLMRLQNHLLGDNRTDFIICYFVTQGNVTTCLMKRRKIVGLLVSHRLNAHLTHDVVGIVQLLIMTTTHTRGATTKNVSAASADFPDYSP